MAQDDGRIRINTEISTKSAHVQLATLENRITKTANTVDFLRSKMNTLKDVKIPTKEYKDLQKELSKAEKEMEKMVGQDKKLAEVDAKIKKLSQSVDEYGSKMQAVAAKKIPTQEYKNLQKELNTITKKK